MDSVITLPSWLVILLGIFAVVMILDRIFIPSVRWYIRRKINTVIDEVNTRLDSKIRPFQLTRRNALIDQLVFDEEVVTAINTCAKEKNMPSTVAQEKASRYANEIVPAFNAYIYFKLGYWLSKKIARFIYRTRVGYFGGDVLKNIDADSCVVFVMNHRSNMDYVLVSFLVAEKTTLSYAVGEWARIPVLMTLIKSTGAFFVRRNSGNQLYRKVLERYVHMSARAGVTQAVFMEGGLSRDGHLRKPKLGYLDYIVRNYHPDFDRDVVFVPVGINYDRVIEDRGLTRKLDEKNPKRSLWFVLSTSARFLYKIIKLKRKERWRRFGYASVNFGHPVSAKDYCTDNNIDFSLLDKDARFKKIENLADNLMEEIKDVIPVLPVALMSQVLLNNKEDWRSVKELKQDANTLTEQLREKGAPINLLPNASESVYSGAIHLITGRGWLEKENDMFKVNSDSIVMLKYYANSISHWMS